MEQFRGTTIVAVRRNGKVAIAGAGDMIELTLTFRTDNSDDDVIAPIPEPTTIALFGLGLAGLGFAARRRLAA